MVFYADRASGLRRELSCFHRFIDYIFPKQSVPDIVGILVKAREMNTLFVAEITLLKIKARAH